MLPFYIVGYLINYIDVGRCKDKENAWIPNANSRLGAIEKGYSLLTTDRTSPGYCAHLCRKQYDGFCPFIVAGIDSITKENLAGWCGRSVPLHESDCNHAAYRDNFNTGYGTYYEIYNTQNLGMLHYSNVFDVCYTYRFHKTSLINQLIAIFQFVPKVINQISMLINSRDPARMDINAPLMEHVP